MYISLLFYFLIFGLFFFADVILQIASHSPRYATKIVSGNKDVGNVLLATISSNPKNDALKATAASALARLSRHSPGLIHALVEKYHLLLYYYYHSYIPTNASISFDQTRHGSKLIIQVLSAVGVSTRLQLAYLNLLNITLLSDAAPRIINLFTADQGLVTDLIGFLDHGMTILRAKALVALCI